MTDKELQQIESEKPATLVDVIHEDDFLAGVEQQEDACPLDGSCESCQ
jgi:hypothetical protein